jgi:hypothetical protein
VASHLARADLPAACPGAAWKTTLPRFRGGLVGAGCSRLDAGANITRRARGVNVPVDLRAALKRRSRAEATADVQADVAERVVAGGGERGAEAAVVSVEHLLTYGGDRGLRQHPVSAGEER